MEKKINNKMTDINPTLSGIKVKLNGLKSPIKRQRLYVLKTKNRVTIWDWNPTPGHISRENSNSKRYMYPKIHSNTINNSQDIEAT